MSEKKLVEGQYSEWLRVDGGRENVIPLEPREEGPKKNDRQQDPFGSFISSAGRSQVSKENLEL